MFKTYNVWRLESDSAIKQHDDRFVSIDIADMPVDATDAERAIHV